MGTSSPQSDDSAALAWCVAMLSLRGLLVPMHACVYQLIAHEDTKAHMQCYALSTLAP